MRRRFLDGWKDTRGAGFVEYLVLVAVVALLAFGAQRYFASSVQRKTEAQAKSVRELSAQQTGSGSGQSSGAGGQQRAGQAASGSSIRGGKERTEGKTSAEQGEVANADRASGDGERSRGELAEQGSSGQNQAGSVESVASFDGPRDGESDTGLSLSVIMVFLLGLLIAGGVAIFTLARPRHAAADGEAPGAAE